MLTISIIIFRECLEIFLLLGIFFSIAKDYNISRKFIVVGVILGVIGSTIIALFTDTLTSLFSGFGQEYINASFALITTLLLGYTIIWMKTHKNQLTGKIQKITDSNENIDNHFYNLSLLVALTMFREGTEIVLFIYGYFYTSSGLGIFVIISGILIGFIMAVLVSLMFYFGLIKLSKKIFFSVVSYLLMFIASGMSAQFAHNLIATDILPALINPVWDSSSIISSNSLIGNVLGVILGYNDRPSLMEALFYIGTFITIFSLNKNPQLLSFCKIKSNCSKL
jgi:high-affinity iron transporter